MLRAHIARTAGDGGLARVSVNGDPVYEGLQPILKFGNVEVIAPPGSFLQAVAEAEAAMGELVLQADRQGEARRRSLFGSRRIHLSPCGALARVRSR